MKADGRRCSWACWKIERDEFIAEWSRLQLEQAWLADASHIESKAREHLGMQTPEKAVILVVEKP